MALRAGLNLFCAGIFLLIALSDSRSARNRRQAPDPFSMLVGQGPDAGTKTCSPLPAPKRGKIACAAGFPFYHCDATCDDGYKFSSGTQTEQRECDQMNGEWFDPPGPNIPDCVPDCDPGCSNGGTCILPDTCACLQEFMGRKCQYPYSNCANPPQPKNGKIVCNQDASGSICTASCNPGFKPLWNISASYVCSPEGTWIPQLSEIPNCVPLSTVIPESHVAPSPVHPDTGEATCVAWGQDHYRTFDNKVYHFKGQCQYILVKDAAANTFHIHVMNDKNCVARHRCKREVEIYIGTDTVALRRDSSGPIVQYNGATVTVPGTQGGVIFEKISHYIIVRSSLGFKVRWDTYEMVFVTVADALKGNTRGLCGVYDHDQSNDFITDTTSEKVVTEPAAFATTWKRNLAGETCSDVPQSGCSTATPADQQVDRDAQRKCDALMGAVFQPCHSKVDPRPYTESCKADCCSDNSNNCVCSGFEAYSRACMDAKISLSWRTAQICPAQCPGNMVYKECGSTCEKTCTSQAAACTDSVCVDGCFCPDGMVKHNDTCIHQNDCPCTQNGQEYTSGAVVKKECNKCICIKGNWDCTNKKCEATCSATGDPHYMTFDGKRFDFMGICSYYMIHDERFDVINDNIQCGNHEASCTKSISIMFEGHTIKMDHNHQLIIDGQSITSLPYQKNGIKIYMVSSLFMKAELSNGITILWDGRTRAYITAPPDFIGKTKGLCGTYDFNQKNDFLTPQKDIETNPNVFGNRWKTEPNCQDVNPDATHNPCEANANRKTQSVQYCSYLKSDIFKPCHDVVDVNPFYESCLFDVCQCSENLKDCLCPMTGEYAAQCASQGVEIKWRQFISECPIDCTGGQIYQVCPNECTRTCDNIATDPNCIQSSQCAEGCGCPPGQALDSSGHCLQIDQCPCIFDGREIPAGKVTDMEDQICSCVSAQWACQDKPQGAGFPMQIAGLSSPCPADMVYKKCVSDCPLTCANMHNPPTCNATTCHPGCECQPGYVREGDRCVMSGDCPCYHGGKAYKEGESYTMECNKCTCKSRNWECENKDCPAVCSAFGDSHYQSFDGRMYEFQGNCDYVLAKSTGGGTEKFEITTENIPCGTTGVTCTKSITFTIGTVGTATFYRLQLVRGKPVVAEAGSPFTVQEVGDFVIIITPSGITLEWDKGTRVYLKLSTHYRGQVTGLCGNFNGDQKDDFNMPQGGIPAVKATTFADSWKVHSYCAASKEITDTCEANSQRRPWAQRQCGVISSGMFGPCHSVVNYQPYLDKCIYDSCACDTGGDCECLCTAIAAYAHQCAMNGVPISWRTEDLCPIQCENCEKYNPCISICPKKTCENRFVYSTIIQDCSLETCVEGCDIEPCPQGQVYETNMPPYRCIPEAFCNTTCLYINGKDYKEGERIMDTMFCQLDCEICYCNEGTIKRSGVCSSTLPPFTLSPAPYSGSPTAKPGMLDTATPSVQPGMVSGGTPTPRPGAYSGATPTAQPGMLSGKTPTIQPGLSSGQTPTAQPGIFSGVTPTAQPDMSPGQTPTAQPGMFSGQTPTAQTGMGSGVVPTGSPHLGPGESPTAHPMLISGETPVSPTKFPGHDEFSTRTKLVKTTITTAIPGMISGETPTAKPGSVSGVTPTSGGGLEVLPVKTPTPQPGMLPGETPTAQPGILPGGTPTAKPVALSGETPTAQPGMLPGETPTAGQPGVLPDKTPTPQPGMLPDETPTAQPGILPGGTPTAKPGAMSGETPTAQPGMLPGQMPSAQPGMLPGGTPTAKPGALSGETPTAKPGSSTGKTLTAQPGVLSGGTPTAHPEIFSGQTPTAQPGIMSGQTPTAQPGMLSGGTPSAQPGMLSGQTPTAQPGMFSGQTPTAQPGILPAATPTAKPYPVNCMYDGFTNWMSYSTPTPYNQGDVETVDNLRKQYTYCDFSQMRSIECRVIGTTKSSATSGQKVTCDLREGLKCYHKDQTAGELCYDYEVRFDCDCSKPTLAPSTLPGETPTPTPGFPQTSGSGLTTKQPQPVSGGTPTSRPSALNGSIPTAHPSPINGSIPTPVPPPARQITPLLYTCIPGWSEWMNIDTPNSVTPQEVVIGDFEGFGELRHYYSFCANPTGIQCRRSSDKMIHHMTGEKVNCDLEKGLQCVNADQSSGICSDYEVSVNCYCGGIITTLAPKPGVSGVPLPTKTFCGWTEWMNSYRRTAEKSTGDYETISNLRMQYSFCEQPAKIECRDSKMHIMYDQVGQAGVTCDTNRGLVCDDRGQFSGICNDYEVRVFCIDACVSTTVTPLIVSGQTPTAQPGTLSGGTPTPKPGEVSGEIQTAQPEQISGGTPAAIPGMLSGGTPTAQPGMLSGGTPTAKPGEVSGEIPSAQPGMLSGGTPTAQPGMLSGGTPTAKLGELSGEIPSAQPGMLSGGTPTPKPGEISGGKPTPQPGQVSGHTPTAQPGMFSGGTPTAQPGSLSGQTPTAKPGELSGETPTAQPGMLSGGTPTPKPGEISGGTPTPQPGQISAQTPTAQPGMLSGGTPTPKPEYISGGTPAAHPEQFSGQTPTAQPGMLSGGTPTHKPGEISGGTPTPQPGQVSEQAPTAQPGMMSGGTPTPKPGEISGGKPTPQPGQVSGQAPTAQPGMLSDGTPTPKPGSLSGQTPTAKPGEVSGETPIAQPGMLSGGTPTPKPGGISGGTPTPQPGQVSGQAPTAQPGMLSGGTPTPKPGEIPGGTPTPQPGQVSGHAPTAQPGMLSGGTPTPKPGSVSGETPTAQPGMLSGGTLTPKPGEISGEMPTPQPGQVSGQTPTAQPGILSGGTPTVKPGAISEETPTAKPGQVSRGIPTAQPGMFSDGTPTPKPEEITGGTPTPQPGQVSGQAPTAQPGMLSGGTLTPKPGEISGEMPTPQPKQVSGQTPTAQPGILSGGTPTAKPGAISEETSTAKPGQVSRGIPTAQPGMFSGGTPTPKPEEITGGTPTPQPGQVSGQAPTAQPGMMSDGTPTPKPGEISGGTPTPQPGQVSGQAPTAQPGMLSGGTPTPKPGEISGGTPTPQPGQVSGQAPTAQPGMLSGGTPTPKPGSVSGETPTAQPGMLSGGTPTPKPGEISGEMPTPQPKQVSGQTPTAQPGILSGGTPTAKPGAISEETPTAKPGQVSRGIPTAQPGMFSGGTPTAKPGEVSGETPAAKPEQVSREIPSAQPGMLSGGTPTPKPGEVSGEVPTAQPGMLSGGTPTAKPGQVSGETPTAQPYACREGWTEWINNDNPVVGSGDIETFHSITGYPGICDEIIATECVVASTGQRADGTGQDVKCNINGMECLNSPMQRCLDYKVRFYCGCKNVPTLKPEQLPGYTPTAHPVLMSGETPTAQPGILPGGSPTAHPGMLPGQSPTSQPGILTGLTPSAQPGMHSGGTPTAQPGMLSGQTPTAQPGVLPGQTPTAQPGIFSGQTPTAQPGMFSGQTPTAQPGMLSGQTPTAQPGMFSGQTPTAQPGMSGETPTAQPGLFTGGTPTVTQTGHPINMVCDHGWTKIMNADSPADGNDLETIDGLRQKYQFCQEDNIVTIKCIIANTGSLYDQSGEEVTCEKKTGLTCYGHDQFDGKCEDYAVQLYCDCRQSALTPVTVMVPSTTTPGVTTHKICDVPMGLSNPFIVSNNQFDASTAYNYSFEAFRGRLYGVADITGGGAWIPRHADQFQWVQVDFGLPERIVGIVTQGRQDMPQWVTTYTVSYSVDGQTWKDYKDVGASVPKIFQGNYDQNTPVIGAFDSEIMARYIRIHPKTWYNTIALRFDVLSCYGPSSQQTTVSPAMFSGQTPTFGPGILPQNSPTAAPNALPGNTPTAVPGMLNGQTPTPAPGSLSGQTPTAAPGALSGETPTAAPGAQSGETPTAVPEALSGETPTPAPGALSGKTPTAAPGAVSGATPTAAPGAQSGETPTPVPGALSGKTPTPTPGILSGETPTASPGAFSGETPTAAPGLISGQTPTAAPGSITDGTPTAAPGPISGQTPTAVPDQYPGQTPTAAPVCIEPMGVDNALLVKDSQMSSSSTLDGHSTAAYGRLYNSFGAWSPVTATGKPWIQVDLLQPKNISGVFTQGSPTDDKWITKFYITTSIDGFSFTPYSEVVGGAAKVFIGNSDRNTVVQNLFNRNVLARHVRIIALEGAPNGIGLRFNLIGCYSAIPTAAPSVGPKVTPTPAPYMAGTGTPTAVPPMLPQIIPVCQIEMGVGNELIVDSSQLTASSSLDNNHTATGGRISNNGWIASSKDTRPWIQVDFLEVKTISGIKTRGSRERPDWVKEYTVYTSINGVDFTPYSDKPGDDKPKVFTGNSDQTTVVSHNFNRNTYARYVRIYPTSIHGAVALSFDVMGCNPSATNSVPTPAPGVTPTAAPSMLGGETPTPAPGMVSGETPIAKPLVSGQTPTAAPQPGSEASPTAVPSGGSNTPTVAPPLPSFEAPPLVCLVPMGLENQYILGDSQFNASSFDGPEYKPEYARIYNHRSWAPRTDDKKPWIEVNFESPKLLSGVITQGEFGGNRWVTQYYVSFSFDGHSFTPYSDTSGDNNPKIVSGNKDESTPVRYLFNRNITAQYIRIYPVSWTGSSAALRMNILGCNPDKANVPTAAPLSINSNTPTAKPQIGDLKTPTPVPNMLSGKTPTAVPNMLSGQTPTAAPNMLSGETPTATPNMLSGETPTAHPPNGGSGTPTAAPGTLSGETPTRGHHETVTPTDSAIPMSVCDVPMGVENPLIIADKQLSASSSKDVFHSASRGRLYSEKDGSFAGAWVPQVSNDRQWIQVDFLAPYAFAGIITQGRADMPQWVTKYQVFYSNDGRNWIPVPVSYKDSTPRIFVANTDQNTPVRNTFQVVVGRFIRMNPVEWHDGIALRFNVIGCRAPSSAITTIATVASTGSGLSPTAVPTPAPTAGPTATTCSYWTPWSNINSPDDLGEFENVWEMKKMVTMCEPATIQAIECRTVGTHIPYNQAGETDVICDLVMNGVMCDASKQADGKCMDYEIRVFCDDCATTLSPIPNQNETPTVAPYACQPKWSDYINKMTPTSDMDYTEHEFMTEVEKKTFCSDGLITRVECETVTGIPVYSSGSVGTTCNVNTGFTCKNSDNYPVPCEDFRVRYYCDCAPGLPGMLSGGTPTVQPGHLTGEIPTAQPGMLSGGSPTAQPGQVSGKIPTAQPGMLPGQTPTGQPGMLSGGTPTPKPGQVSGENPTAQPGMLSGGTPSPKPGQAPGEIPTAQPGMLSGGTPTAQPGQVSGEIPTAQPGMLSGGTPTAQPGQVSGKIPTAQPGILPGQTPTAQPGILSGGTPTPKPGELSGQTPTAQPGMLSGGTPTAQPEQVSGRTATATPTPACETQRKWSDWVNKNTPMSPVDSEKEAMTPMEIKAFCSGKITAVECQSVNGNTKL